MHCLRLLCIVDFTLKIDFEESLSGIHTVRESNSLEPDSMFAKAISRRQRITTGNAAFKVF